MMFNMQTQKELCNFQTEPVLPRWSSGSSVQASSGHQRRPLHLQGPCSKHHQPSNALPLLTVPCHWWFAFITTHFCSTALALISLSSPLRTFTEGDPKQGSLGGTFQAFAARRWTRAEGERSITYLLSPRQCTCRGLHGWTTPAQC